MYLPLGFISGKFLFRGPNLFVDVPVCSLQFPCLHKSNFVHNNFVHLRYLFNVRLFVDQKNVQGLYELLNRLILNNRPSAEHFPLYTNVRRFRFSFDIFVRLSSWNFIHLEQAGSPCFPSQHKAQILPQGKKKAPYV